MRRAVSTLVLSVAILAPTVTLADGGEGSRQSAGGGFMSSYVSDPYHDPRSARSHRLGTGQIQGQPMLDEGAGVHRPYAAPGGGHWASGTYDGRHR